MLLFVCTCTVSTFCSTGVSAFGLAGGKLTACIAPVGHSATHFLHILHLLKSIYERLFSIVIAPKGQTFSHFPQPIQATSQFFFAAAPFSLFMQETKTLLSFRPYFLSSITPLGHALTHAPQATHFSSSTSGNPVSGLMCKASNLQALEQLPKPKQPKEQPPSPAKF